MLQDPITTSGSPFRNGPFEAPKTTIRKAIILAAGIGDRLRPFTQQSPKCLVPVNGVPILVNALTHLSGVGVKEVVIVVGHHKEKIYESIGDTFQSVKVSYIESENYASTNNIYSLWLAREHLVDDVFLLEADVFFDRQLLERLLSHESESLAAVSRHQIWMSGTVVTINESGNVLALIDSREQGRNFDYSQVFKTVNVYLFRGEFLRRYIVPHLEAFIASGEINEYYEVILHAMAHRGIHNLRAVQCDDLRWYEIDDESDRRSAEYLFSTQEHRYEMISGEHGGYWRYDFVDHAYLYNLYFPPEPVFAHFRNNLHDLVLNYPVAQNSLARMLSTLTNQPAERIVVANGASELIKIIASLVTERLIVPVPSFNEYEEALPEGQLVRFALGPPSFNLDVDAFAEEAARCEASIAVVVTPNNPTSLSVARSDLCRLAEELGKQNCTLLVDESFVDFSQEYEQASLSNELDTYPNLVILKSMSKAFGIGGLRLGYLLTADKELAESVRSNVPIWNINGLAEAFLRVAPRYRREFAKSCVKVRIDRDDLYQRLNAVPGMIVYEPDANFVFCRLPDAAPSGPEVARALFVENNILIKHCAGKSMPDADRYLRIASRTVAENCTLAEALRAVIDSPPQATDVDE
jgi:histidinol-phosphate/aromatic aminotransferase/cobyric acid decarboxylase-like protein/NDP-sugar pyrophosphorylase family protein